MFSENVINFLLAWSAFGGALVVCVLFYKIMTLILEG